MTDAHWLVEVLRQRATVEQDWNLNRPQRWGYSVKAIVCLLLRREVKGDAPAWSIDKIEVAHSALTPTYSFDYGEGGEFDYLAVGIGVFRRWWYLVDHDGWP